MAELVPGQRSTHAPASIKVETVGENGSVKEVYSVGIDELAVDVDVLDNGPNLNTAQQGDTIMDTNVLDIKVPVIDLTATGVAEIPLIDLTDSDSPATAQPGTSDETFILGHDAANDEL
ncbi:hypothetical protein SARC_09378 [Sphaeroforma arctica JP610]|uniref:Uncharacterized protein n=1 Tax=Sphaeroforma arctica JP610 TaxID=667725 RepID=A0A0L0FN39_9EUKA|nr:hypothetical protein SARC_09378 [Sphaeroforma arctica JP610]KNC78182.1 hypothetical protein SARC_09378 [Sphaeroforma arctica JP610]|eukprot:XP_014152084.1 hypothetical protein SARC_09378 [Sphaeroforma arctica JP610]